MSETSIHFKVFLRDEEATEARRFTVEIGVVTNFLFMKEKIKSVFPSIRNSDIKITWKDNDGDEITITDDEDFITAYTEMNGSVKILYVTVLRHGQDSAVDEPTVTALPSSNVICDICNEIITGFRYKCLQCPDYDLCSDCEHQGHHADHILLRVPNADVFVPKSARKFASQLSRSMKRSAYMASKDACRTARACRKYMQGAETCSKQEKTGDTSAQDKESSQQDTPADMSCFLNDLNNLGNMAMPHLDNILEAFGKPNQNGNPEANPLYQIIRNVCDGFLGKPNKEEKEQKKDVQTGPSTSKTDQPVTDENANKEPSSVKEPAVPVQAMEHMEITEESEGNNLSGPSNNQKETNWTFVAQSDAAATGKNTSTNNNPPNPTPTLIYHENPVIAEGLLRLHEMGFSNEGGLLTVLLERFKGNVPQVVKALVEMHN